MTETSIAITERNISNLLKVINLALRKPKFQDAYTVDLKNLVKKKSNLGKTSVNLVNDCLRSHHFDEAAKLLWIYCQDRCTCDIFLYKGIMVVLENLQFDDAEDTMMKFCGDIQDLQDVNQWDVKLEYIIYALRNNVHNIQSSFKMSEERLLKLKKDPYIALILTAYCALLDYITWRNSYEHEMSDRVKEIADRAISGFKNIIDRPGTWDIFVFKLIEMLEHYENHEEIIKVLKKYVKHNPEHINAYIYLCVLLYKYDSNSKEFIHYSKELSRLCPSDTRVLLLVQKWNEFGKKLEKRLRILLMFLDYPVNGKNLLAWQMLASHLSEVFERKKPITLKAVKLAWNLRCQVWKYIYFNPANIHSDVEDNPELLAYKVKVLSMLEPDHIYRKKAMKNFSHLLRISSTNLEEVKTTNEICESFSFYNLESK